jgi:hypothetical protein
VLLVPLRTPWNLEYYSPISVHFYDAEKRMSHIHFEINVCCVCLLCSNLMAKKYIFHKNREISILMIKKKTARLTLPQEATERTKQGETKNKTKNTQRYEQKCQSHTCSGTINSNMYDSDLTITTSPLTSSAPYSW